MKDTLEPSEGMGREGAPVGGKRDSTSTGAVMPAIRSLSGVELARRRRKRSVGR